MASALVASALQLFPLAGSAHAAEGRVDLRVLVVTNGSPSEQVIVTQLDRQGVPYHEVVIGASGRPTIDSSFLVDAATAAARYQAVVLPNQAGGGLASDEMTALSTPSASAASGRSTPTTTRARA